MFTSPVFVITLLHVITLDSTFGQDCPSRRQIQGTLKQVQKLLTAHETSYAHSLRNLKKKINLLQNSATKLSTRVTNITCPKLDAPLHGRKLGKSQSVGHEVHFLCDPGYELVGSESRLCQESLLWSSQQPTCRDINECASSPCLNGGTCVDEVNQFSCVCAKGWAGVTCQSPVPTFFITLTNTSAATSHAAAATTLSAATNGPFVRTPRCTITQGTTHCTCEPGYSITGRDNYICTDIDECELFQNGLTGRPCQHTCVNTAGGYRCACPAGYDVNRDGRSCKDIDECATRLNNCTKDQMCINTNGGFQCVRVECPKIPNATYVKTSPMRCERNPCPMDNKMCTQTPNSFSYHYLSVVSNLSAPRVMFRVSALRQIGDTLRFSLLGGRHSRRYFTVERSDHLTGQLMLVKPVQGPATLEAEVEMTEMEKREQLGRYITKVTMFVSQYDF